MDGHTIASALGRCAVFDATCALRSCLHVGHDKGTYSPGRGYTSYHAKPRVVCMTRHLRGCPTPLPGPDPARVRCCPAPTFKTPRGDPGHQTCGTCGKRVERLALPIARTLPALPHTPCKHAGATQNEELCGVMVWRCPHFVRGAGRGCGLTFERKPEPFALGTSVVDMIGILARRQAAQELERLEREREHERARCGSVGAGLPAESGPGSGDGAPGPGGPVGHPGQDGGLDPG